MKNRELTKKMSTYLDKCFLLPWTENDNPNGWIEPTTYCQLRCPGCYRGADKPEHKPFHLEFEEVKNQVDWMIKNRNVHTISIAGGEPLLYPQIYDIVDYCSKNNLRTMLYTNGVALNEEVFVNLQKAGLTQALIHIDRFQQRPDNEKGSTDLEKRSFFVELFRKYKSIQLGFIQPLAADFINDLDEIVKFSEKNIDIVSLLVFTLYREVCWNSNTKKQINTDIEINQVVQHLQKTDDFVPASFLASEQNENEATWLFATKTGVPGKNTGYFSPKFYKIAHQRYREYSGKYLFISRKTILKVKSLLRYFWIENNFKIIRNYLKFRNSENKKNKNLYFQTFLLLRGPIQIAENKWDLCKNCPDRIIYNGKLVPSCILEDLKNRGNEDFKNVNFE